MVDGTVHNHNIHAFDVITPESAYWVGFLMADGNITESGRLQVKSHLKDAWHLERLRSFLGAANPIRIYGAEYKFANFAVRSPYLAARLARYGVTPRKSFTARVCDELAHDRDFWRGVVDGDGCVYLPQRSLSLVSASIALINQFVSFAEHICPGLHLHVRESRSAYQVAVCGKKACAVLAVLYQDSSVALARKYVQVCKVMGPEFMVV